MKTSIKSVVLIAIAFILFLSCNQEKAIEQEVQVKNAITEKILNDCLGRGKIKNQICENKAYDYLNDYKEFIDDVRVNLDKQEHGTPEENRQALNYGSQTTALELLEVLLTLEKNRGPFDEKDKVFLMNARKPAKDTLGNAIIVTETVFVVEPANGDENYYFDFTRPCPNGCPENVNGIKYLTEEIAEETIK
jgi:hypothetical protein